MTTVKDLLKVVIQRYPHLSLSHVRVVLASHVGQTTTFLFAHPEYPLSSAQRDRVWQDIEMLAQGTPLSRILGRREFWGHDFFLSPETLDPRPDSETLIEAILKYHPHKNLPLSIVDMGTGTGCLLLSLLKEYPYAAGLGVDYSLGALETAQRNAHALGVGERAQFQASDWWKSVEGAFDLIISNPPYISDEDYLSLDPVVRDYDPMRALKGGKDGLDAYRTLIKGAAAFLKPKGHLIIEIGWNQAKSVSTLLIKQGFTVHEVLKDLGQNDRILVASWPS